MNSDNIKRIYDAESKRYDALVWPTDFFLLKKARKELISDLKGKVLEIGIGTGANLPMYQKGVEVTGIDLSPNMLEEAKRKADKLDINLQVKEMNAEDLKFPDKTFDAVVSTLILCTITNPIKVVEEMRRVVKDGGKIRFIEHGKSSNRFIARFQDWRAKSHLAKHACHLTREPIEIVKSAGLVPTRIKRFFFGIISIIHVDL